MATGNPSKARELVITREFDAPPERLWNAWTDPEMVKRWWGPEGFSAPSIKIDLRVGGMYVFAMQGPPGSQLEKAGYNAGVFKEIVPNKKLVLTMYFSDESGKMLPPEAYGMEGDFPSEETVTVRFEALGQGRTRLSVTYPMPEDEAQYQAILESGMAEGWESQMNKMEQALR